MEKSFYYIVSALSVVPLSDQLNLDRIPHSIETNVELPRLQIDELAIVFPNLLVSQYNQVRYMFGKDGERYPN
jgi:hypothetical protein